MENKQKGVLEILTKLRHGNIEISEAYNLITKKRKKNLSEETLHTKCKDIYEDWCKETDNVFDWNGRQAKSLNAITEKIRKGYFDKFKNDATDENISEGFKIILDYLPEWYKENDFSLSTISSKYSGIISQIKNNGTKKGGFSPSKVNSLVDRYFDSQGK